MNNLFSFKIYATTNELPENWDNFSVNNIFLSKNYLKVLEFSAPTNMQCRFISIYQNNKLVGIAITQMISLTTVSSFGVNKNCLQSKIRDFVFKKFASNVLLVGNNMLTGQNAFCYDQTITFLDFITALNLAVAALEEKYKLQGKKIHILNYKDFYFEDSEKFKIESFKDFYNFEIQPNMIFEISENWNSIEDYIAVLSKKYRDQYKRSHKKADEIIKSKLGLDEIIIHNSRIQELYLNVTKNAPFNTFYLSENHFIELKKQLNHNFLFYGYFINNKLIGFNTLIKNGSTIDTYFLGYDDTIQRDKMLYLNMLYDMINYSINKKFKKIIFARTALEIKSSVGAKPNGMFGYIKHNNKLINKFMPRLFKYFEPEVVWQERNPFKS
ncbi:MAG: 8-amino-7-oxononanoate synthase [Flavobacterium sp.]|nr:8-amino-7-oxononanoate synthase [Flavobacterium sp.]